MYFTVLEPDERLPERVRDQAFLTSEFQEDWGKSTTRYVLTIVDNVGIPHLIGELRLGKTGMTKARRSAALPKTFDELSEAYFSLGQDDSYYERLKERSNTVRQRVLAGLRDIAANPDLYASVANEGVTKESLLASVTGATAQGQFRRLAKGGARLTSYRLRYTGPPPQTASPLQASPLVLDFEVKHDSVPPSNIHVLIGQNGVGKTHILELMTRALLDEPSKADENGVFERVDATVDDPAFSGVVSVTFSAFDPFDPIADSDGETGATRYSYVGLKNTSRSVGGKGALKNLNTLTMDFSRSLRACTTSAKAERWRDAVRTLESDAMFKQQDVLRLMEGFGDEDDATGDRASYDRLADDATEVFLRLSTGHKIVLLTITRLIETVEERTIVLFDEPESHLHPPLLSAFMRALSDLLINRNGVAIIATHSSVVLQEVPASCVWKLQRFGPVVSPRRPKIETFGENLGVLTSEVFRLEVTNSGFHNLLSRAVDHGNSYESVVSLFSGQLGAESKAHIRALIASRASGDRRS